MRIPGYVRLWSITKDRLTARILFGKVGRLEFKGVGRFGNRGDGKAASAGDIDNLAFLTSVVGAIFLPLGTVDADMNNVFHLGCFLGFKVVGVFG